VGYIVTVHFRPSFSSPAFSGDPYGSIFFEISVASSKRRMIGIAECVMILQGHPRSMIFVSSERAYATFY